MSWQLIVGELVGTFLLILLGNGVCAANNFKNMHSKGAGWLLIAIGWGLAIFVGAFAAIGIGGLGHLNPAVTLYWLISFGKHTTGEVWGNGILMIIMQFVGALLAQILLNVMNWKHIKENDLSLLKASSATGASHENAWVQNVLYEFVGTTVLILMIYLIDKSGFTSLGPLPVALVIMSIGMSLGGVTGFALNPARDWSPRLVYQMTVLFFFKDGIKDEKTGEVIKAPSANWVYGSIVPGATPFAAGLLVGIIPLAETFM